MFPEKAPQIGQPGDGVSPERDSVPTGAPVRDLVPLHPAPADEEKPKPGPSRLTGALFLAHMFATKFKDPQTREKRRAEPGEANATYRKAARPPATRTGRNMSKKI